MSARREIGKWLNEQPNREVDKQALAELCVEYDILKVGHDRYEIARRMNPRQWADAWKLNLSTGKPFDEIIDSFDLDRHNYSPSAIESEIARLRAAIQKTLDENGHLADGDDCTLIELKRAIGVV